jgi:hypothetical protein
MPMMNRVLRGAIVSYRAGARARGIEVPFNCRRVNTRCVHHVHTPMAIYFEAALE